MRCATTARHLSAIHPRGAREWSTRLLDEASVDGATARAAGRRRTTVGRRGAVRNLPHACRGPGAGSPRPDEAEAGPRLPSARGDARGTSSARALTMETGLPRQRTRRPRRGLSQRRVRQLPARRIACACSGTAARTAPGASARIPARRRGTACARLRPTGRHTSGASEWARWGEADVAACRARCREPPRRDHVPPLRPPPPVLLPKCPSLHPHPTPPPTSSPRPQCSSES